MHKNLNRNFIYRIVYHAPEDGNLLKLGDFRYIK